MPRTQELEGIAICWWGFTIALAIDDDEESRSQLAEATGDPDAWRKLSCIQDADEDGWADFLAAVLEDPVYAGLNRPAVGQPGYDRTLDEACDVMLKLAFGIRDGRPEALPR
jgi:hypothetical protein